MRPQTCVMEMEELDLSASDAAGLSAQAGVETCYPQILPHDRGIHCPGACSPYVEYPRTGS